MLTPFRGYITKTAWAKAKWRSACRLPRQSRSAVRSWWWRTVGYADRIERENREFRAAAEFRFRQYREAADIAYHLHYPPTDAGGALLLAADKITNEGPHGCEHADQEYDTGAWNCSHERRDEICWCAVADELRSLEKALREGAPHNAQAIEARRAATGTGAVHESAVRQDAPNQEPQP